MLQWDFGTYYRNLKGKEVRSGSFLPHFRHEKMETGYKDQKVVGTQLLLQGWYSFHYPVKTRVRTQAKSGL